MPPKAGEEDDPFDEPWPGDVWHYHDRPPPPSVEVDYEPPEFVGTLLGPDGEPLRDVFVAPPVTFGFQPSTTW